MKHTSKTRQELLDNTVSYFNLGNRASNKWGTCHYITRDGKKCAIGVELSDEKARGFEASLGDTCVCNVFYQLPERLQNMGLRFLEEIQDIHDDEDYWTEDGLSKLGVSRVSEMCDEYNLELPESIKD